MKNITFCVLHMLIAFQLFLTNGNGAIIFTVKNIWQYFDLMPMT